MQKHFDYRFDLDLAPEEVDHNDIGLYLVGGRTLDEQQNSDPAHALAAAEA